MPHLVPRAIFILVSIISEAGGGARKEACEWLENDKIVSKN
jgi:hypothetical protein